MKTREYVLYVTGPKAGERGFPGKWSKEFDPSEQITGAEFQSSETKPTQKDSKTPMTIQPIKFSTLAELASGSPIVCIQGKLASLFEPKKGEGDYGPWTLQGGTLTDGQLKHDVTFADEEHVLPMSAKGKNIRVTSQEYKGKLKGIELKEKNKKRSVNIKFPAKIEIQEGSNWVEHVAGSGDGSETASSGPSQSSQASAPASQSTHSSSERSAPSDEPVETRIANFFKVYNRVCLEAGKDPDEMIGGLSSSDIKEISTGIVMSFKEGYIHRAPYFADDLGKSSQSPFKNDGGTASPTPTTSGEAEETEPVGWREVLHKGVKLGDYEEESLAAIIQWAVDNPNPKTDNGRAMRPQFMLADAELRGPASKKISKALASAGMGQTFDEAEVEEVCMEEFGSEFAELHYPSLFALGTNLDEYVAKMQAAWKAKQPAAAAPKKVAKKPAAASVEDDDEDQMPS